MLANPRVAAAVDRVGSPSEAAAFDGWLADGPHRLAALVDDHAPAAAGAEHGWLPREGVVSEREGADGVPQLYASALAPSVRATAGVALGGPDPVRTPVGVPLLDEAHLQVGSTPSGRGGRRPRRWSRTLVMRAGRLLPAGDGYVHVWDVGQLTGSLPGSTR